ncbi:hypothetical protein ACFLSQ_07395 [Bacteroidota bacterium]
MNSYTFGINGSWWWYVLLIIITVGFTIYTYRHTVPPISKVRKIVLMTLRSLGIGLLLFILFEPIITIIGGEEKAPKLAVLLDNSQSAAMNDASGNRKELFTKSIENSDFTSIDNEELEITIFDARLNHVDEFNENQLDFKGQMTDISKALRDVMEKSEQENIQAVLLISDGAFNSGTNPIYDADILGKPIFTIGIGDSSEPKDVSLQSILTNEVVYVENPVPVNINIKTAGYEEGEITITLYDNEEKIGEQVFSIHPERQAFTAVFEFAAKTEGVHKLKAKVSSMTDEITLKNNSKVEYVEVIKNKRKVTIFAGAPSPDVSFTRNALDLEKGVKVKSFIQKDNNEYYEDYPTDKDLKETELFILIGFPINSTNPAVLHSIKKELEKGKSILFIASRFVNYHLLRIVEEYLPFNSTSSKTMEFSVLPDINPNAISSPLLRITGMPDDIELWNQLPPVFRTETFVRVKPESEIVSTMKINNVPLKEPLILTRSIRNQKSAAILGYGLYRWKLLGYASDIAKGKTDGYDLFTIFIQNSVKWLAIDIDNKLVDIKTTKKLYTNTEKVEFLGQIYDPSYNPVENATVNVIVKGSNENKELILNSLDNGRYIGEIEGLTEGGYYYSGEAIANGRKIGSDKGRFSVGEIALEYRNLSMNAPLLRALAERTGGKFYIPGNAGEFINDLLNTTSFRPKALTLRSEFTLWNLPWLIIAAILCFSIEWYLRKMAGMI